MIRNTRLLHKLEKNQLKDESISYPEALKIFKAL